MTREVVEFAGVTPERSLEKWQAPWLVPRRWITRAGRSRRRSHTDTASRTPASAASAH
jgi:hypothetical protein